MGISVAADKITALSKVGEHHLYNYNIVLIIHNMIGTVWHKILMVKNFDKSVLGKILTIKN